MAKNIRMKDVDIYYGKFHAVQGVSLSVPPQAVTAFIGPSGCGKSNPRQKAMEGYISGRFG